MIRQEEKDQTVLVKPQILDESWWERLALNIEKQARSLDESSWLERLAYNIEQQTQNMDEQDELVHILQAS